jgi:beta-glucosidase
VIDDPPGKSVVDVLGGLETSRKIAEQSSVLLRNENAQLPLDASNLHRIAVIGAHSDVGMISGGGSAQVDPPVGNAILPPGKGQTHWLEPVWFPTSPLKAIRARVPNAKVEYDAGTDPSAAATLAKNADVAIVFAHQWESEGMDLESLKLPENQDDLIVKVAAANAHTIVVLETGGPVTMPWAGQVAGILEVWYAGSSGADAVASLLFGDVNPSGKLPITFPKSDADLPHPTIVKPPVTSTTRDGDPDAWKKIAAGLPPFQITYDEGLKVGYKWYDAENKPVLFPFGFGLSYTSYSYSNLKVTPGKNVSVTFTVANTGKREGAEVAQVYVGLPVADEPPKRLVGWSKVSLKPGESREVTVPVDPRYLSIFKSQSGWQLVGGDYTFMVGGSSQSLPLKQSVALK